MFELGENIFPRSRTSHSEAAQEIPRGADGELAKYHKIYLFDVLIMLYHHNLMCVVIYNNANISTQSYT